MSQTLASYRKKVLSNVAYDLNFVIPEGRADQINGSETIHVHLKENKLPLQIDFKGDAGQVTKLTVNGNRIKPVVQSEHIVIPAQALKVGKNIIEIAFTVGDLSLNRSNEFLYTLLVPDRARTVFPCFDQPDIKARFSLALTVPAHWQAVSNAPVADSTLSINSKTYQFRKSDLFSTYLFSFVAGKFQVVSKQVAGRNMNLYHRETDGAKLRLSVDSIFYLHEQALRFMEDYTGIPYPYQKLDIAAIPDFQYGGMEHVGAIDYKAATLFLDSGATKDQLNARNNVIAHETAHMWFGDLVTMKWFNDVWMKEVFANFMADKVTRKVEDSIDYQLRFLLTHFPRAYGVDRTAGANAIRQQLPNLREAGSLYGPIIYNKAPIMMQQLEGLMGEDAFKEGIRAYLKKYSFGNATWPDLITILDNRTAADLQQWNRVWVNTPGRPLLDYRLQTGKGVIKKLTITQKGEQSGNYILPQLFDIALVYPDTILQVSVHMNAASVDVAAVAGRPEPLYILFNSSGKGYGVFPIDKMSAPIHQLKSPVMRAAAYINQYENMLSGNGLRPMDFIAALMKVVKEGKEPEELILNLLAGHITETYWRFIPADKRNNIAATLEMVLWNALQQEAIANKKKVLFRAYQNIALTDGALQNLFSIWKEKQPPTGVQLSEDDYTSLALNLSVKGFKVDTILSTQPDRITNPDRKQRFQFLLPALSPDEQVRDQFFATLKDPSVRKKESWVADALGYLHHPLRSSLSVKYLAVSLELLQEVQTTGDIFFPSAWLSASFGGHQSSEAAEIVRAFLKRNPSYNEQLKMKILQAADPLFRAERLLRN